MDVAILGINGFVGQAVAQHAVRRGYRVLGIGRSSTPAAPERITYVTADRANPARIRDILHRRTQGVAVQEPLDEAAALRSTVYPYRGPAPRAPDSPDRYLDDYDKIPIEQAVQRLSSPWTILRLPMIYGPGDKQHRFRWALASMLRKRERLIVPTAWASWQSTYGYIENVGASIAAVLGDPRAERRIFNVAEREPTHQLAWAHRFAQALEWTGPIETTDDPEHPFARQIAELDLTVPLCISGDLLRTTFEFTDPVDVTSSLLATIDAEATPGP